MERRGLPPACEQTFTRRSFLEWLGYGGLLISGLNLSRCGGSSGPGTKKDFFDDDASDGDDDRERDIDSSEAESDADYDELDATEGEGAPGEFPFQPGDELEGDLGLWMERTVDRQTVENLLAEWRLTVDGLVESPRVFTFPDLIGLSRSDQITDFHCVEGWSVYDVPWNGVHANRIMELVRPLAAASYVTFHTVGGKYNESLPIAVLSESRTLLGYGVNGYTLPLKHGFPLRVVAPRLLGYKNAKYVERIEFTDHPAEGYWVQRGYPYDGEVPPGRLREGKY
ncbi:MAG: hypothetical protein C4523_14480 [Myxococcales bacterium]|nr:MAG: hypothetical protein C4523_14480 [Myxococcales bacterium]